MVLQVPSRAQRRMEKKQALILLVLIVAVALVSFALGGMGGRGGRPAPMPVAVTSPRMPVTPAPAAGAAATAASPAAPASGDAASPSGGEHLTFYDTLPKGQQPPLGSGINLPPSAKGTAQAPAENPPAVKPQQPRTVASPPPAAKPAKTVTSEPAAAPAATAHGAYVVQVASFKAASDAQRLRKRLTGRHFPAFAQEANLGAKGVWHRVLVGPFATVAAATTAANRLRAEEHLPAMVKKR